MIKVIAQEKDKLELEIDNLTIAETLRNFLWDDDSVSVAAWKRDHPTKNPILMVKTKGKSPKKAILDAITKIEKTTDKVLSEFKSSVKN